MWGHSNQMPGAKMKRETAPPTYDSDSTETDEEAIRSAVGAPTYRPLKREAATPVHSVASPQEPRPQAPIPPASVVDLGYSTPTPALFAAAAQSQPLSAPAFSNSILDLPLGPPVVPALNDHPPVVPFMYPPVHPPQHHQAAPERAALPVAHAPASVQIATTATNLQPTEAGGLVHRDGKCAMCKQAFAASSLNVEGDPEHRLSCACCQRELSKSSFSKNQRNKLPDERRCGTCSAGGAEILDRICRRRVLDREAVKKARQEKLRISLEKRRATIARKKENEERERLGLPPIEAPVEEPPVQQQAPRVPGTAKAFVERLDTLSGTEALDAQVAAQGDKCALCKKKFEKAKRSTQVDTVAGTRCCCCQRQLTIASFSLDGYVRTKLHRCLACDEAQLPLRTYRETPATDRALAAVAQIAKMEVALEKRRATIARKKLEMEQAERDGQRGVQEADAAPTELVDMVVDREQMERALRDILRDHRSIVRRRVANDLDGPYREEYELQLLDEESKLHMKAATLRLENEVLYDDVCRELEVVDGAVRYGERDHEQGENDQDKPTEKQKKKQAAKNLALRGIADGHALLEAAKATANQQRAEWNKRKLAARDDQVEEKEDNEPARKQARRGEQEQQNDPSLYTEKNSSPPRPLSITTRLRRRTAKPVPEVIEIDDSDY